MHYLTAVLFVVEFIVFGWMALLGADREDTAAAGIGLLGMMFCGVCLGSMF